VLDYGAGNIRSAQRALEHVGAVVTVTDDAAAAAQSDALVVPGVGHYGQCVRQFVAAGLRDLVEQWVAGGRPLLGICVGMQILYPASDEDPDVAGLDILPGAVKRLPDDVVVPHMGWDTVVAQRDDPLLDGVAGEHVYFVHSYAAVPSNSDHVVATSDYGPGFPAVVRVGSVVGTQFHPEKSAAVGARLLRNWVTEVAA
jgi:imidazole glycerol phosphate synthase glutamine amidotransferase subunit